MDAADLATYLEFRAPAEMSWSQICNLVRIRRAVARPLSLASYEAIRFALADAEARHGRSFG
jgi:hypothetical protein